MAVEIQEQDIMQLRLEFVDTNGHRAFNILHYRLREVNVPGGGLFPGEDSAAVLPVVAQNAGLMLRTNWALTASNRVWMTGVTAQSVHPAPKSAQYHFNFATPFQGDIEDDVLPMQDAPTILKKSAFGARWGIGRMFVVGTPELSQNDGFLTNGAVIALNNWCEDLAAEQTAVVGGNTFFYRPTLFSPTSGAGGTPRITELVSINVSDPIIKTQRRRRPGKGI